MQSTQLYPNIPLQMTKVRDLDFLQNDKNIIYSLQIPIVSTRGETSGVKTKTKKPCSMTPMHQTDKCNARKLFSLTDQLQLCSCELETII